MISMDNETKESKLIAIAGIPLTGTETYLADLTKLDSNYMAFRPSERGVNPYTIAMWKMNKLRRRRDAKQD